MIERFETKERSMRSRPLITICMSMLVVLMLNARVVAQDTQGTPSEPEVTFRSPQSVWLKINHVSKALSEADMPIRGGSTKWIGNASLRWEVDVPDADEYEVYFIANVPAAGDGTKITIESGNNKKDFIISKTSGPFPGGENFKVQEPFNVERKKLSGSIHLEAGKQVITVSTAGIESKEVLFSLRGVELLPLSKKEMVAAEEARAKAARADVGWMVEAGYGVMFHWTSGTPQADGTRKPYEEAVNDFDVDKFVNMVEATGAGYVIFPVGHAESYCPAPLESWERIHPGQTTKRDLIEELANALNAKDISLICYLNGPLAFQYPKRVEITPEIVENFVANFQAILPELGMRYKEKIAGYWFDTMILEIPYEEFFKAAKVGYEDRVMCLNSFIWTPASPWQDYWSGEVQHPIAPPVNGFMENGPAPNLPYQVLLTMEKHSWGARKTGIKDPKFTSEELAAYIKACMQNGGAVTINLSIYQDGTVGEKALEVMKGVKAEIRK